MLLKGLKRIAIGDGYPFTVPAIQSFESISFDHPVTIIVGNNGTGKTTLLEMIAQSLELPRISDLLPNSTTPRFPFNIHHFYQLIYTRKPQGFFFRSEDFTHYIHFLRQAKQESLAEIKRLDVELKDHSAYARQLAKSPHYRTINDVETMYDHPLDEQSHGERYLDFFRSRLQPNRLYILDEVDVPLSFENQLALLVLIKEAVDKGSQFIISTHSPVFMSYPHVTIFELSETLERRNYEELSFVRQLKNFLNHPEQYLKHLFD